MCLASVVVFITTYALILPAITMEPEYICGNKAHLHSASCYQLPEASTVSSLLCTSDTLGIHEHTTDCHDENGELQCGIADFVLHTHNSDCFIANGELVCLLPERKEHTHDETCFQQPHVHIDACYIQQHGELLCKLEEGSIHIHSDACHTLQETLICTLPETAPHTHTPEACYTETKTLLCNVPESEGHTHTAACLAEDGSLTCPLPEIAGHTHADTCFQTTTAFTCTSEETEGHTHSPTCFETVRAVTCALEEGVSHVHTDACFICTPVLQCAELTAEDGAVPVLICEKEELCPHTHEPACFNESGSCICNYLQISEHIHGDTCFVIAQEQSAEPVLICGCEEHEHVEDCIAKDETDNTLTADQLIAEGYYCGVAEHSHASEYGCFAEDGLLMCSMTEHVHTLQCTLLPVDPSDCETAEDWEVGLPELTGEIATDVIAVAQSQVGYEDSDVNYIITEDDEVLYYSRYAAWWDETEPYGDWNAKFVSFCLDYAGITDVPLRDQTAEWPSILEYCDQWHENDGEFQPIPADLVFFDIDSDGTADRAGIIAEIDAENGAITVILERYGLVQQVSYDLIDGDILGYARIPGNQPVVQVDASVEDVIAMIDDLPAYEEMEATLLAYEEAEDWDGYEAYFTQVGQDGLRAYNAYQQLTEEQQAHVTNIDRLMDLSSVWSVATLEFNDQGGFTIYARNAINSVDTTGAERPILVYGDYKWSQYRITSDQITNKTTLWRVIEVRENRVNGRLYVHYISGDAVLSHFIDNWALPQYIDYDGDGIKEGFNVLIPTAYFNEKSPNLKVGDAVTVTVNADNEGNVSNLTEYYHRSSDKNNNRGMYNLFFGTDPKEPRDNSNELTEVQGAKTFDLIEVNLFDYNSNINSKYFSNADGGYNFLGFQQDYGTKAIYDSLNQYSFNFGNNITMDLDAGDTDITERGGNINGTVDSANKPISGVVRNTSQGGYPITNAEYSFDFYFDEAGAPYGVTKLNDKNIDGLFLYNEETGAYTFDSRENHAQFDAVTDKFILYEQRFSPNFIMYPFGNFMPLNDINTQCVQASKADRSYLLEIARSAKYKRENGAREEYGTLSNVLYTFIDRMDSMGMGDWTSGNIVQQYFDRSPYKNDLAENPGRILNDLLPWIYTLDYDEPSNFYFGMNMRMNFMMPKNGMTGKDTNEDGQSDYPMVFEFAGDDDVWVYIDDVLFLDLSGIHRHVGGTIDFVNGCVHYYAFDSYIGGKIKTDPYKTETFAEILQAAGKSTDVLNEKGTFKDYSHHSFDFFYTERGSGSSVCRMNFNFPLLKQNAISVAKELTSTTNVEMVGNPDFEFQILKANSDGSKTSDLFIGADVEYTIYDTTTNAQVSTRTTDANGVFTLKAGQRAEFTGIAENSGKYYVRELLDTDYYAQYGSIKVNGSSATINNNITVGSDTFQGLDSPVKDVSDGTTVFTFNNQVDATKLSYLTITKIVNGVSNEVAKALEFDMMVELHGVLQSTDGWVPIPVGTPYTLYRTDVFMSNGQKVKIEDRPDRVVTTEGIVTVPGGATAEIDYMIPGTTYRVYETSGSAEGYKVVYEDFWGGDWITAYFDRVEGTIPIYNESNLATAHVCMKVTNTVPSGAVSIPVTKALSNGSADPNTPHTYSFTIKLESASDYSSGSVYTEGKHYAPYSETKQVQVTGSNPANFNFVIAYSAADFSKGKTTILTYSIKENKPDELESTHDTTEYTAIVVVTRTSSGSLSPAPYLYSLTKDGQSVSSADFVNTLLGEINVTKKVAGAETNQGFEFFVWVADASRKAIPNVPLTIVKNGETTTRETDSGGRVYLSFKNGETVTIQGVPLGCTWRVQEQNYGDYAVSWEATPESCIKKPGTDYVEGTFPAGGVKVVFTNTAFYELPETGGGGVGKYMICGVMLLGFALLCHQRRKRYSGRRVTGG